MVGWQVLSSGSHVRFGSLANISQCNRHVRFTPESDELNAFMRDPALKSSLGVLIDFLVIPRKRMALLAQSRC
jgi:hypothetical protein